MRLLVTRPEPDAERTAAVLRARGHDVVVAPVLRIEPVAAEFSRGPFAGVIMTSANAAQAIAAHPRLGELTALPVFAVGAVPPTPPARGDLSLLPQRTAVGRSSLASLRRGSETAAPGSSTLRRKIVQATSPGRWPTPD
jgi:hypothetical protein